MTPFCYPCAAFQSRDKSMETRFRLSILHSALSSYDGDLGRFPHLGKTVSQPPQVIRECYDKAGIVLDPKVASRNVLLQPIIDEVPGWEYLGLSSETYQKRWKGPYLMPEFEGVGTSNCY